MGGLKPADDGVVGDPFKEDIVRKAIWSRIFVE